MIDRVDLEYLINKSYLWNDESRREMMTADVSASSPRALDPRERKDGRRKTQGTESAY